MENKHEQAREHFNNVVNKISETFGYCSDDDLDWLENHLVECEETENKYDELVKDVKEFINLLSKPILTITGNSRAIELKDKLSKVGVSNE